MQRHLTIRMPITALMFRCANANGVIILSTLNYGADMGSNHRMAKWHWMAYVTVISQESLQFDARKY